VANIKNLTNVLALSLEVQNYYMRDTR